ncbi:hypothetical protein BJ322DRAFT_1024657 [Thelephora terrestris]|uniref:Uncharacterized protein n=1 Tax=Thelephora terrestris TaxID=56493 RepID=A0A9P6L2G3_9AGAM|nr:hypothetical protein BJ322DRAFT_1024657 [Thelephora terrestris]
MPGRVLNVPRQSERSPHPNFQNDVHQIHSFLQLGDPVLPLSLHSIQETRRPIVHNGPVGVFITSLLPEVGRSLVLSKGVNSDFNVKGNVGGGVIQMVVDIAETKGVAAAFKDMSGEGCCKRRVVVDWWEWKRDDERRGQETPQIKYIPINGTLKRVTTIHHYSLLSQKGNDNTPLFIVIPKGINKPTAPITIPSTRRNLR